MKNGNFDKEKGGKFFTTPPFLKQQYEGKNRTICPKGQIALSPHYKSFPGLS